MGLLYTTEGTRNILDTLNTAFDGSNKGLKFIRDKVKASELASAPADRKLYEMVYNQKWRRGHLATTLQLFPYNQNTGGIQGDDKARWAFFLKTVVGAKFNELRKALSEAILNTSGVNIASVSFSHVEKTGSPNLVIYDAPLTNDLNGPYGRHITLFTRHLTTGERADFDAPDSDDGPPIVDPPWQKLKPS
jgi:hypothetical protein